MTRGLQARACSICVILLSRSRSSMDVIGQLLTIAIWHLRRVVAVDPRPAHCTTGFSIRPCRLGSILTFLVVGQDFWFTPTNRHRQKRAECLTGANGRLAWVMHAGCDADVVRKLVAGTVRPPA